MLSCLGNACLCEPRSRQSADCCWSFPPSQPTKKFGPILSAGVPTALAMAAEISYIEDVAKLKAIGKASKARADTVIIERPDGPSEVMPLSEAAHVEPFSIPQQPHAQIDALYHLFDGSTPIKSHVTDNATLEAFTFRRGSDRIVVIRGTDEPADAVMDIKFRKVNWYDSGAKVHRGFLEGFDKLKEFLEAAADEDNASGRRPTVSQSASHCLGPSLWRLPHADPSSQRVIFVGHSFGGAVASLCSVWQSQETPWRAADGTGVEVALFTVGCPRVGDGDFARLIEGATGGEGGSPVEPETLRRMRIASKGDPITKCVACPLLVSALISGSHRVPATGYHHPRQGLIVTVLRHAARSVHLESEEEHRAGWGRSMVDSVSPVAHLVQQKVVLTPTAHS